MKLNFKIHYDTRWGQNVLISGSAPELGEWQRDKAVSMYYTKEGYWELSLDFAYSDQPILYSYLIGEKNMMDIREYGYPHSIEYSGGDLLCQDDWQKEDSCKLFRNKKPYWRASGVAIPVFSLRSEKSFGIGEFDDLKLLVDWAKQTGQQIIQVLPVNDTTMTHTKFDSYPYNAISIYALHPLYLNLQKMGRLKDKEQNSRFDLLQQQLNVEDTVHYEQVDSLKWEYFRLLYAQEGEAILNGCGCQWFIDENKEWLYPYSLYCYLRERFNTSDFHEWGEYSDYKLARKLLSEDEDTVRQTQFYVFLQYHLYLQLLDVHQYADEKGILLKGDIPIGISRNSVEAWIEPQYFHLDAQTGAPPDPFSATGQNWGFPTYNWETIAKDGYSWWKKRFQNMALYFDAFRIDHILGFFRIWEIPKESIQGMLGHFSPALPLSIEEIEESGVHFQEDRLTSPYITDKLIQKTFGKYGEEVIICFFERNADGTYRFKKEFDSQLRIANQIGWQNDNKNNIIRKGLFDLVNEVLFIEDPREKRKYHPRIACRESYSFSQLSDKEQECMNRIHDDFYYFRHTEFWMREALKRLPPLLSSTDMLGCGEDLGMIPSCVPEVMEKLQLLSLEIQRMPKQYGMEFGDTNNYPYRSVCSTSTHDMSGIRGWWQENRELTQHYYNHVLRREGEAPDDLTAELCQKILEMHLQCPSMIAIFPLQDWLSMDATVRRKDFEAERINVPANPKNNWCYRMHLTLESLKRKRNVNAKIKDMIEESNRTEEYEQ